MRKKIYAGLGAPYSGGRPVSTGFAMTDIPIIDFKNFETGDEAHRRKIAAQLDWAASEVGFMYVDNPGIDQALLAEAFASSAAFFGRTKAEKKRWDYIEPINHGYQGPGDQRLDPTIAPDLKEAFTMRDIHVNEDKPALWPSPAFLDTASRFFDEALRGSNIVMEAFALALDLPIDFFRNCHYGQNVALRYLRYPACETPPAPNQLGCGAHTDFGTITLLFQDDVGGLQIQGRDGVWRDAVYIPGTIIINTADLVATWTNDRYCSTPHRVKPMTSNRDRYSIAYFVDPDTDTPVSALPSCTSDDNPARYPDTTAGAYVQQRIADSNKLDGGY
ncbi:MAG: isopenicillin N synthase family oxygenase [Proteobacteria bacterium]|nr:isopenicillin N synthase family oxygenase [Pseudomonadota bacterium]